MESKMGLLMNIRPGGIIGEFKERIQSLSICLVLTLAFAPSGTKSRLTRKTRLRSVHRVFQFRMFLACHREMPVRRVDLTLSRKLC